MEFDIEKNKVVGIVGHRLKGDSSRIKIIGYINSKNGFTGLKDDELIELLQPIGHVFAYSFFTRYNWAEGELIQFKVKKLEYTSRPDDDIYGINYDTSSKLNKFGDRVFDILDFKVINSVVNLSITRISNEDYSHSFFGFSDGKIFGKLKIIDKKIVPEKGHYIRAWNEKHCNIFKYKSNKYLLCEPDCQYELIDAMENNAAFYWFRQKLTILNTEVVSYLNNNTNWKTELPDILANADKDKTEVEKIRLQRIVNNFDNHNLLVAEIKELAKTSEKFERIFINSIERHKNELRSEYVIEIDEFEKNKNFEKQKLEVQLSKISLEIAHKKKELSDILEEIKSSNSSIGIINSTKERILSDFSIIQDVLGNRTLSGRSEVQIHEESFVMETFSPSQNTTPITQKDKFLQRLKYFLNKQNINSSFAGKLISICASCRGFFLNTIELGLAFIEATGNSKYIIQQVEPDWLHFKDLWKNGLGAIWKSSHENPDKLHFLILEDLNLSSPECYMRPLLDCMNGIRKHIPYAKTAYPNNLRILATKISSEEPKIGLPLYQQTFYNWGAIGFTGDTKKPIEQYNSISEGYIEVEAFSLFKSDEPFEDYATKFIDDYKVLFGSLL